MKKNLEFDLSFLKVISVHCKLAKRKNLNHFKAQHARSYHNPSYTEDRKGIISVKLSNVEHATQIKTHQAILIY